MTFEEYQDKAHATSLNTAFGDNDFLTYPIALLGSEAGECLGLLQKVHRDKAGHWSAEDANRLMKEAGDALWAIAEIATSLGVTLDQIAEMNIEKLSSRQRRGVIGGNGDER